MIGGLTWYPCTQKCTVAVVLWVVQSWLILGHQRQVTCPNHSCRAQDRCAGALFLLSIVPSIGRWCNSCPYPALISLLRRCTMKAPKLGVDVRIPGNKQSKIAALKKLGDAGAPAKGRVTAQPPKGKVRRPVFMPRQHVPMGEWLRPRRPRPESITMACINACRWRTHLRYAGTAADGP